MLLTMMNLWNWLKQRIKRKRASSARRDVATFEQTLHANQNIADLIHQIAENEQRPREEVENEILAHTRQEYQHFEETRAKWHTLSVREQEVVALSCLGYTNDEIASKLVISPNTVKAHMRNILHKFSIRSKAQLSQLFRGWDFNAFDH